MRERQSNICCVPSQRNQKPNFELTKARVQLWTSSFDCCYMVRDLTYVPHIRGLTDSHPRIGSPSLRAYLAMLLTAICTDFEIWISNVILPKNHSEYLEVHPMQKNNADDLLPPTMIPWNSSGITLCAQACNNSSYRESVVFAMQHYIQQQLALATSAGATYLQAQSLGKVLNHYSIQLFHTECQRFLVKSERISSSDWTRGQNEVLPQVCQCSCVAICWYWSF